MFAFYDCTLPKCRQDKKQQEKRPQWGDSEYGISCSSELGGDARWLPITNFYQWFKWPLNARETDLAELGYKSRELAFRWKWLDLKKTHVGIIITSVSGVWVQATCPYPVPWDPSGGRGLAQSTRAGVALRGVGIWGAPWSLDPRFYLTMVITVATNSFPRWKTAEMIRNTVRTSSFKDVREDANKATPCNIIQ